MKMFVFPVTLSVWLLIAASLSGNAFATFGHDGDEEYDKTAPDRILSAVNKYRILHGAEPLFLNRRMSAETREMAERMARGEKMSRWPYGKTTYAGPIASGIKKPEDAVNAWYAEEKAYDWKNPEGNFNKDEIRNFTQMIWKGSRVMGFGSARDSKGTLLAMACSFNPPGNLKRMYKYNVLPAISAEQLPRRMEGMLMNGHTLNEAQEEIDEDARYVPGGRASRTRAPATDESSVAPAENGVTPGDGGSTAAPTSGASIPSNANHVAIFVITSYVVVVKMPN